MYRNQAQNLKVYFNPYLEITPLKGLTFITRAGASLGYSRSNTFTGEGSVQWYKANQTADGIKAQVKDNRSYNYKWENILTYNFQIKKVHDITLTAVTSWNHNRSDVTTLYQKVFLIINSYGIIFLMVIPQLREVLLIVCLRGWDMSAV